MLLAAYCSSSGGTTVYIQQLVHVMRLCWLAVGRIGILPFTVYTQ